VPAITILTEADLRQLIALDLDVVACVERAFISLASGTVAMPPILRLDIPEYHGEVDVKTAYVSGLDSFAIKISPGFFDNPKLGLPSVNGLMVLFSARTGLVEALFLDNGYLTDIRTAAAGAVGAKHLSRPDSRVATIFGAGVQARLQLEALTLVRPIREARIWARNSDRAEAAARDMAAKLGIDVTPASDPQTAVAGVDIVVTTTPSTSPLIRYEWLSPGQHITAMGSDAEHKNELDPAIVARADLYAADSLSQVRRLGELHHAVIAGLVAADAEFTEIGAIAADKSPGRPSPEAITVCDLTGTGVQDTAIATFACRRAADSGVGVRFES
jgi:ornithine cyclodeaminase